MSKSQTLSVTWQQNGKALLFVRISDFRCDFHFLRDGPELKGSHLGPELKFHKFISSDFWLGLFCSKQSSSD